MTAAKSWHRPRGLQHVVEEDTLVRLLVQHSGALGRHDAPVGLPVALRLRGARNLPCDRMPVAAIAEAAFTGGRGAAATQSPAGMHALHVLVDDRRRHRAVGAEVLGVIQVQVEVGDAPDHRTRPPPWS